MPLTLMTQRRGLTYEAYIREIMNQTGLVGCWMMNPNRTFLLDLSGNNNHGTINGATWVSERGIWTLDFDGNNDYVEIDGVAGDINKSTGTICLWFQMGNVNDWTDNATHIICQFSTANGAAYLSLTKIGLNALVFRYRAMGSNHDATEVNPATLGTIWHQIVGSWDISANELRLYIDGILIDSNTDVFAAISSTITLGNIARRGVSGPLYFGGLINEVAIYNVALSAATIKQHYIEGKCYHR